jgi:arylformamidase
MTRDHIGDGYRSMSPRVLEREYSPSTMVGGDISGYLADYAQLSAEARRRFPCREDLRYGHRAAEVLDYFPAAQKVAPLFVFVHGGYWQELSQKDSAPMAAEVLNAGFAFATVNYTLALQGSIELMVEEVAHALGYLQRIATDFGFDPKRITLAGHSAGAHLAAMQITLRDPPFDPQGLECLLLLSGIYDLDPIPLTSINDPLGLDAVKAHALSPMFLAPVAHPRATVAVAERDTREFRRQSKDFALHLGRHGVEASYLLVPDRDHFGIILDLGFALGR